MAGSRRGSNPSIGGAGAAGEGAAAADDDTAAIDDANAAARAFFSGLDQHDLHPFGRRLAVVGARGGLIGTLVIYVVGSY